MESRGHMSLEEAFSSRRNSIAFLRWLFAIGVVFDHSWALGGFDGGVGPISHWTGGQFSIGGLSVVGFFVLSGFLVTRSRDRMASGIRYFWHRFLRIFPAFWVCLLITAFVLAPIEWHVETGKSLSGLFSARNGPVQYVRNDFLLTMNQFDIGSLLSHTPYAERGKVAAWDGSLWTLIFEFRCYIVVAVVCVAATEVVRRRAFVALAVLFWVALNVLYIDPTSPLIRLVPFSTPFGFVRYTSCFMLGTVAYFYADRIPIRWDAFVGAALVFLFTLHSGGLYVVGFLAFAYCVLAGAVLIPIHRWDRVGDLSYGIYIYAFPTQMLMSAHNFQRFGELPFIATAIAVSSLAAFASWHLIEKRALRLKGATWPRTWRVLATRGPAVMMRQPADDS
jgi:peptidoglycan/LPS O-acetylase OafA/YrhL